MALLAAIGRTLQRVGARLAPTVRSQATYEGASTSRRLRGFSAPSVGVNAAITYSLRLLRDRSHAAVRNDGYSKSAIDSLVSSEVGVGIVPQSQAPDFLAPDGRQWRDVVRERWDDWTLESDADGVLEFYGQQALAVRGWREGGEMFVRLRPRLASDGLAVPLQVQLLEPELCPETYTTVAPGGNPIRAGIEFNGIGRRVAYWCYQQRPEQLDPLQGGAAMVRLPEEFVVHLFQPLRAGQLRGLPLLTQALVKLHDLDKYDDATLIRQQLANMFVGFVTPPQPDTIEEQAIDPATGRPIEYENDQAVMQLQPGTMRETNPGEQVTWSDPPEATGYAEFMKAQLRGACVATGVPYELLTSDVGAVSDRSLRYIVQEFRSRIEQGQHQIIAHKLNGPIWEAWLDRAILADAIPTPPGYWTDPRPWRRVEWIPPAKPYTHPVQDVQAEILMVAAGFKSPVQVARERGWSIEQIYREIAAAKTLAKAQGITVDWSGGKSSPEAANADDSSDPAPPNAAPQNGASRTARASAAPDVTVNVAPPAVTVNIPARVPMRKTPVRDACGQIVDVIETPMDSPAPAGKE